MTGDSGATTAATRLAIKIQASQRAPSYVDVRWRAVRWGAVRWGAVRGHGFEG